MNFSAALQDWDKGTRAGIKAAFRNPLPPPLSLSLAAAELMNTPDETILKVSVESGKVCVFSAAEPRARFVQMEGFEVAYEETSHEVLTADKTKFKVFASAVGDVLAAAEFAVQGSTDALGAEARELVTVSAAATRLDIECYIGSINPQKIGRAFAPKQGGRKDLDGVYVNAAAGFLLAGAERKTRTKPSWHGKILQGARRAGARIIMEPIDENSDATLRADDRSARR